MAKVWYLQHTKEANLRFKIVKLNTATKQATLQGPTGVPFDRDISEESLAKYGYTVVQREEEPGAQPCATS